MRTSASAPISEVNALNVWDWGPSSATISREFRGTSVKLLGVTRVNKIWVALLLLIIQTACTVGPLSKAEVISADEKEVVIMSDGFIHPMRTANRECGRFGKNAKLYGQTDAIEKQLYYYHCQ